MFWIGFTIGCLVLAVVGTYDGFPKPIKAAIKFVKDNLNNFINKA